MIARFYPSNNMPWGRRLSAPLGAALLAWGGLIVVNHTWTWQA
jgi:hypothetical protein